MRPHRFLQGLRLGVAGLGLMLTACQSLVPTRPSPQDATLPLRQAAPGVYYFQGDAVGVTAANHGLAGNSGFIVGPDGVVVIDTGSSRRRGEAILQAIHTVTDQPVRLVIITHARQEFLFGNSAFADRGIPILAHPDATLLMRARCTNCLKNLKRELGDAFMAGTTLTLPTQALTVTGLRTVGGRSLRILAFDWAASPGDLAVIDEATGVLFAGDLLAVARIPGIQDARLEGWLAAIAVLRDLHPRAVVPAFGPLAGPGASLDADAALAAEAGYLQALDQQVRQLYNQDVGLAEATRQGELPHFSSWAGYPELHYQNIHYRFLQLESADLLKP